MQKRIHPLRRLARDVDNVLHDLPIGPDTDNARGPAETRVRRAARSITELYSLMAIGVLIWVVYLAIALPSRNTALHYDLTWVGFDCFIVASMVATAYFAWRFDPAVQLAANATATLMVVDAWFDITTSSTNSALLTAILFAVFLELPLGLFSLRIASRINRAISARARAQELAEIEPSTDAEVAAS